MSNHPQLKLAQRADYTYKYNLRSGRHGWLRLTPAYSVKMVEELIAKWDQPLRIFDPFCGTGTTALSAAYHHHEGITTDINPFLVWLGRAKTAYYNPETLAACQTASRLAIELTENGSIEAAPPPPIHNIERWWSPSAQEFLCRLRASIEMASEADSQIRNLLLVAFCRTVIALSNAAFNHQSMSFKTGEQLAIPFEFDMGNRYGEDVRFVLSGANENPSGSATVKLGDARNPSTVINGLVDRVITSPPYVNRMSYIRELRPYMYWLGFLVNARDAGELDWLSVGGTWGIATSRLAEWTPGTDCFRNNLLDGILEQIAHQNNKNGYLLATYIAKYFDDMWAHFQDLRAILADGAEIHYIVGNSTFYNILVPVEQMYATMLEALGFHSIACRPVRKRNSKKELIEFDVSAVWNS
jgi:hypothetical protein